MTQTRLDANIETNRAMLMLAGEENSIFIGQNVEYDGNVVFRHLNGVPRHKCIELPVAEEMQTGMAIGLAMVGYLPVSIYPRFDFMLRAADQIVNHLDKLAELSNGEWTPKVILRTRVGSRYPLNAGPQHTQNHAEAFRLLCSTIRIIEITRPEDVLPAYQDALGCDTSVLVVESLL